MRHITPLHVSNCPIHCMWSERPWLPFFLPYPSVTVLTCCLVYPFAPRCVTASYLTVMDELGFLSNDPEKLLLGVTATPYRR